MSQHPPDSEEHIDRTPRSSESDIAENRKAIASILGRLIALNWLAQKSHHRCTGSQADIDDPSDDIDT